MIMDTEMTIQTEQIDDLPLLFGLLQKMGLQPIVDAVVTVHPLPPSIPPSTEGSQKPPPDVGGRLEGGERLHAVIEPHGPHRRNSTLPDHER